MWKQKINEFKMPLIFIGIILAVVFFGAMIPESLQQLCYAVSLTIKEIILFVLPVIIFSLIFNSIVKLKTGAIRLILWLLPLLCLSNLTTSWVAFLSGQHILQYAHLSTVQVTPAVELAPLWVWHLPEWLSSKYAMLLALISGLLCAYYRFTWSEKLASTLNNSVHYFLTKCFIPILPLFILGFLLKMRYDGILVELVNTYGFIFLSVVALQLAYCLVLYAFASQFKLSKAIEYLKNMFPAAISGFSTMSSAAALPLTLIGTEKNTKNEEITDFVIPGTVNFHTVGDCIGIPIFMMAIMYSFGYGVPSVSQYIIFSLYFMIAKFGVAAIPGGGILVMLPILTGQFGFTSEMFALIQMFYVVFDCVNTATNILGNGAFAILFNRFLQSSHSPADEQSARIEKAQSHSS